MSAPAATAAASLPGTPITERTFSLPSLRLHAVEAGPEDGPLVLLLHGFPELWYGWRYQIPALAQAGFRVLAPDQRGYNLSDKPRALAAFCLDRLAEDVMGLLDAVGRERACVAGHDWGAAVTWWTAVRFPERVERLAILNVPHPLVMRKHLRSNPAQRKKSWYIFFFQLPWLPELVLRRRGFRMLGKGLRTARPGTFGETDFAVYRSAWSQPGALRAMVHWYRAALRRPPARVPSPRVKPPTLALWGEKDRFLGVEMIEPSLALCDAPRLERFPAASHWLQHEEPAAVNRLLVEFFSPA